jgi:hypothetical protein
MSRMSMPFGRYTITTTVSGSGSGWGGLLLLGLLVGGAVYLARRIQQAVAPYADTIETTLTVAIAAIIIVVVAVVAVRVLPDIVTLPRDQRRAAAFARHCHKIEAKRAELVETAQEAAATLADDEPEGLDGTRDGKLIDAAGRFRSLGTFLPVDDVVDVEIVDQEPVDRSTRIDQGRR